ncbi:Bro-N domain-containing protein [Acidovorax sp.]|uniref:BRO-N domain-containing protein n=1 Tax=Acidovorax sp. TaxID=1872122 RepID=UPI002ACD6142|nr:BRO family protein [Acidovorax sp.]MDZ7863354.1 BRO family protein [Acidovorax sp.]
MSNIIPFKFGKAPVRVIEGDSGTFEVVAKDVAEGLGYTWQANVIAHVPEEWKGVKPINTPGGVQQMATLTESGLYFFLGRSDKPDALPMQKWVSGEVLPSIRKTGSYSMPKAQQTKPARASERYREAAVITREQLKICKLLGVDDGMAKAITAKEVRNVTGLDFTPLLTNVTATHNPRLTVTELVERIGSGAKSEQVNAALEQLGFQTKKHWTSRGKPRSKWELTDAGKQYGALATYQAEKNDHSGYRVVWHADVLELVQPLVLTAIADRAAAKKPKRATPPTTSAPAPEPQEALL